MANALKKITTEAKRLRRLQPGKSWKAAIKQAGVNYRAGKLGSLPSATTTTLRAGKTKIGIREKVGSRRKKREKVSGPLPPYRNLRPAIGKVSAGSLRSELKRRINESIDKAVVRKFRATGKQIKRKLQQAITDKKAQLRRLE